MEYITHAVTTLLTVDIVIDVNKCCPLIDPIVGAIEGTTICRNIKGLFLHVAQLNFNIQANQDIAKTSTPQFPTQFNQNLAIQPNSSALNEANNGTPRNSSPMMVGSKSSLETANVAGNHAHQVPGLIQFAKWFNYCGSSVSLAQPHRLIVPVHCGKGGKFKSRVNATFPRSLPSHCSCRP